MYHLDGTSRGDSPSWKFDAGDHHTDLGPRLKSEMESWTWVVGCCPYCGEVFKSICIEWMGLDVVDSGCVVAAADVGCG